MVIDLYSFPFAQFLRDLWHGASEHGYGESIFGEFGAICWEPENHIFRSSLFLI